MTELMCPTRSVFDYCHIKNTFFVQQIKLFKNNKEIDKISPLAILNSKIDSNRDVFRFTKIFETIVKVEKED